MGELLVKYGIHTCYVPTQFSYKQLQPTLLVQSRNALPITPFRIELFRVMGPVDLKVATGDEQPDAAMNMKICWRKGKWLM